VSWSDEELIEAVERYRAALIEGGTKPGTASVYISQVDRFVRWLTGRDPGAVIAGRARRSPSRTSARLRPASASVTASLPESLRRAIDEWGQHGRSAQPAMQWHREKWIAEFPQHEALFRSLPEGLDRDVIKSRCGNAAEDRASAEAAFIVSMVWGYGVKGYGRPRTARVLATNDAPGRLQAVVRTLMDEGAVAAYDRLGKDQRLRGLGPAFGTKFLYFCQSPDQRPRALIHDEFVASWLRDSAGINLSPLAWSTRTYAAYLGLLHRWADELACEPDDVELAIFHVAASSRRSPWAPRSAGS